jgi:hypothetical protein
MLRGVVARHVWFVPIAARGVYEMLDELDGPQRAEAAAVIRRFQEQYLIDQIEVILNNGVTVAIPPLHNDVFTATLKSTVNWTTAALQSAKTRVENAIARVEAPHPSTAAGLTIVVGWGLPYFRTFTPSLMNSYPPAIPGTSSKQYAVLDAIQFPSDPSNVVLESNHVMFKFRSDSSSIVSGAERALFDDQNSGAYIGDLFDLTSKRIGFLGRGFGTRSVGKTLALAAGGRPDPRGRAAHARLHQHPDPGARPGQHPELRDPARRHRPVPRRLLRRRLRHAPLAPVPGHPDRYGSMDYSGRVKRMFSPRMQVPTDPSTVTIPNGPAQVSTMAQVKQDAAGGLLGHNALLQQAARLGATVYDNYGRRREQGTSVPLREDFNTLDDPFFWAPGGVGPVDKPGMHFVAFLPGHHLFHRARLAMDGVMPDGTNFRQAPYSISDENNGINARMRASHRQNYVIPPRRNRSFPLVELLK